MQFLHPTFLLALGALAIPIIIHLFHFRRFKKVYFTNVHLLKELKEETSTRNRLRSLMILLARCAALAMLVFAFAQPLIKKGSVEDNRPTAVEIILDNSYSMQSRKAEVPLLTMVKDRAREIINSYGGTDQFLILTHELQAKHQRYVDQETALGFVDDIQITPSVEPIEDLTKIVQRIGRGMTDYRHSLYILSDFQENISQFDSPLDTSYQVSLIPFRAVQENNVALVNAKWEGPVPMKDQPNKLIVQLENFSSEAEAVELRMNYDGQERPLGTVNIPAASVVTDTVNVAVNQSGWHRLELMIDDYPIEFDNHLYTSFLIDDDIDVLNVYNAQPNQYVHSALNAISQYNLTQQAVRSLRYEHFKEQDLIILDDLTTLSSGLINELEKYVSAEGNLLVFPSVNADLTTYNNLLGRLKVDRLQSAEMEDRNVSRINTDAFVFNNVYLRTNRNIKLPRTKQLFNIKNVAASAGEWLLKYRDGSSFLNAYQVGKGHVYLCASPLHESANDLVRNAEVFVPMLYKMAISIGERSRMSYTIGQDNVITLSDLVHTAEKYTMSGPVEFITAVTNAGNTSFIDVRDQVSQAGYYDLKDETEEIATLAFNYDRIESDVQYGDITTVQQGIGSHAQVLDDVALADLSSYIKTQNDGIPLWRWCLIGALLFLLLETLLIRFWKG